MPVTIYPTNLKYKNSNGQFQSATAIKGDSGAGIVEQVNGTAPTIVCEDNHRYICGEILSLNITPPANGVCEIIFESGSTATLLTIPNTIKWPEWFNPNALETSATYQFKISNGLANVAIWPDEGLTGDTRVRIQKMLGVYEAPWELIREDTFTNPEEANYIIDTDNNGQTFELTDAIIWLFNPKQNNPVIIGDYGRVYFMSGQDICGTVYLSANTIAENAQKVAYGCLTQSNGLTYIDYCEWNTNATHSQVRRTLFSALNAGVPFRIDTNIITSIKIQSITGTMSYKLYGRRKW